MVALSLGSAYSTHVAAERDAQADGLHVIASQQWAEEQQIEQQIDAQVAQDVVLTTRLDTLRNVQRTRIKEASALARADPARAGELSLQAQEAWAQYHQLFPLLRLQLPTVSDDQLGYDEASAKKLARALDPKLLRASSAQTREEAVSAAALANQTVLVVLILVLSLFVLTIAHVVGRPRGLPLAWFAAVLSAGAVLWSAWRDIHAALPIIGLAAGFVLLLVIGRAPVVRRRFAGIEHEDHVSDVGAVPAQPGAMAQVDPADPPRSRFDRFVVIAIAFATLLGAAVGYLQGDYSRTATEHAWTANHHGVQAIGALRTAEETTAVWLDTYAEALTTRVAGWNATQRAAAADASGDHALSAHWEEEAGRLSALAERLTERSGVASQLGSAGIDDLSKLASIRAAVWEKPATILGTQDAANATAKNWGDRAGRYLTVLTWLAVAVYLLGLSLVFRDRSARLLLAVAGTGLIVLSAGQGLATTMSPGTVPRADAEAAASAYGAGVVAMQRNDPQAAVEHFTRALDARPDFGMAHNARAMATVMLGSTPEAGIRAGFTDASVEQAIDDMETATDRGVETPGMMIDLGAMLIHRSINTQSLADMERSIDYSRKGLELGGDYDRSGAYQHFGRIIGRINLALALLGTGDPEGAEEEYRQVARQIGELPPQVQPQFVAAGMVLLDLMSRAPREATAEQIVEMKNILAASLYPGAAQSPARVTSATAKILPGQLQWAATMVKFDRTRDSVAIQWSRLNPAIGEWEAIPNASGLVTQDVGQGGQFRSDRPGSYVGHSPAMLIAATPAGCVGPGTYRVELYLNGTLAATAFDEVSGQEAAYQPVIARDVGAAMCVPMGWTMEETPGVSRGAMAPDGKRGVVLFIVQQPLSAEVDSRAAAINRVAAESHPGLLTGLSRASSVSPPTTSVFGRPAFGRTYFYPGGTARFSAVGLTSGTVLVACTFGDGTWTWSPEATTLLNSTVALRD